MIERRLKKFKKFMERNEKIVNNKDEKYRLVLFFVFIVVVFIVVVFIVVFLKKEKYRLVLLFVFIVVV